MTTRIANNSLRSMAVVFVAIVCAIALCCTLPGQAQAAQLKVDTPEKVVKVQTQAKKKKYTIGPNSKPLNAGIVNSSAYSAQTKHFWLIKSYMDQFEKVGGGTLVLKKGTYKIPSSIQVPSNVTIIFKSGVKIKKTTKVGKSTLKPNTPLFQLVSSKKYSKKNSVGRYKGTKNVSFIGQGNVVFDMSNTKGCAIIMAQNQNVTFSNITFQNAKAHFFELDASKNVTIENCTFKNLNGGKTAEAINLDTPDKATGGFSFKWCKLDKTPNDNVVIKNCTFSNVSRGIGTHKYSQKNGANVMHKNIQILNNTFTGISGYEGAVVPYNWENVTITGNTFVGKGTTDKTFGIVAHSVVNANIANNTFSYFNMPIIVRRGFSSSGYGEPAAIYLTDQNKKALATNKCVKNTMLYNFVGITQKSFYWDKKTSNLSFSTIDVQVV